MLLQQTALRARCRAGAWRVEYALLLELLLELPLARLAQLAWLAKAWLHRPAGCGRWLQGGLLLWEAATQAKGRHIQHACIKG
jgi:hypothetical protein